jgi:DNA polymerase-1
MYYRPQKPYNKKDAPEDFYTWSQTQKFLKTIKRKQTKQPLQLKSFHSSYQLIDRGSDLEEVLSNPDKVDFIGIDTETTGLDPYRDRVRTIQIAFADRPTIVIDLNAISPSQLKPLRSLLASDCLKIGHNLKFDLMMLSKIGLPVSSPLFDTYLAYKVLTAGLKKTCSLEAIAKKLLGIKLDKSEQKSDFTGTLTPSQLQYAATDAAVVISLYQILKHQLNRANLSETAKVEFDCISAVASMELNGIYLDLDRWQHLGNTLDRQLHQLKSSLLQQLQPKHPAERSLLGELSNTINLRSPTQVITALHQIGIEVKSTNVQELIPLAKDYPAIGQLLEYRSIATRISTFSNGLPDRIHPVTGRIHGKWWQLGARSGRFSCSQPNLTNIPRDKQTRACFPASPGNVIIKADYSQIELRLIAKVSGDRRMISAYQQGRDLHRLTASFLFDKPIEDIDEEERRLGKIVNFGLIYGMGISKFRTTTAIKHNIYLDKQTAKEFRDKFFNYYDGIAAYHARTRKLWQQGVRASYTLDGRRRLWSSSHPPTLNELLNHPIQGTNATIIKGAIALFYRTCQRFFLKAKIIAVVHDEIVIECPQTEAVKTAKILKKCAIAASRPLLDPLPVEVTLQIGTSWDS